MAKRRGLGRGLDALLGTPPEGAAAPATADQMRALPVDLLQRGRYQPRGDMRSETLQELADSIRAQGVVQPIVVRPMTGGRYEIVAGERRWRAAQLAGLQEIPAVVREVSDRTAMSVALIENLQREDLNPLEEGTALQRLVLEFEMTHQEVADALGRSRASVTNMLRLLDLHAEVKRLLERGAIDMGHARALLSLEPELQPAAATQVVSQGLSVRATEQLVRTLAEARPKAKRGATPRDPDVARLERELSEKLGAPVVLKQQANGRGQVVIRYHSLDELDGILAHIN